MHHLILFFILFFYGKKYFIPYCKIKGASELYLFFYFVMGRNVLFPTTKLSVHQNYTLIKKFMTKIGQLSTIMGREYQSFLHPHSQFKLAASLLDFQYMWNFCEVNEASLSSYQSYWLLEVYTKKKKYICLSTPSV